MNPNNDPTDYIYVPLKAELYAELVRRSRQADVATYIEHSVAEFLDRTEGDPHVWSEEYIEGAVHNEASDFRETYGDPGRGYQWQTLFLPNGTSVKMLYHGRVEYAEVRHDKLTFNGDFLSPSQFASKVAEGTSRNAWRDLYIKFPGDASWKYADGLRRATSARANPSRSNR